MGPDSTTPSSAASNFGQIRGVRRRDCHTFARATLNAKHSREPWCPLRVSSNPDDVRHLGTSWLNTRPALLRLELELLSEVRPAKRYHRVLRIARRTRFGEDQGREIDLPELSSRCLPFPQTPTRSPSTSVEADWLKLLSLHRAFRG